MSDIMQRVSNRNNLRVYSIPFVFSLVIGLIGLIPHIYYSFFTDHNQLHYFKYAYDEDFYAGHIHKPIFSSTRILSALSIRLLNYLTNEPYITQLVADFIFPFLAALLAFIVCASLCRDQMLRICISLLLLFGQELFSLGSSTIWTTFNINNIRLLLPDTAKLIIPDYYTSYFSLFRTPEPQVSWIAFFLIMYWCINYLKTNIQSFNKLILFKMLNVIVLVSVMYFFISVSLMICMSLFGILLFVFDYRKIAVTVSALISVAALITVLLLSHLSPELRSIGVLFQSRLPIITPGVLASLGGTIMFMILAKRWKMFDSLFLWGIALLATPFILMNQQIVTGIMTSTRDWERYAIYPMLILGFAICARHFNFIIPSAILQRRLLLECLAVILITSVLISGQFKSYRYWESRAKFYGL